MYVVGWLLPAGRVSHSKLVLGEGHKEPQRPAPEPELERVPEDERLGAQPSQGTWAHPPVAHHPQEVP